MTRMGQAAALALIQTPLLTRRADTRNQATRPMLGQASRQKPKLRPLEENAQPRRDTYLPLRPIRTQNDLNA